MEVDEVNLLRELDFTIVDGSAGRAWQLRSPTGSAYEVELVPAVERLTAHAARNTQARRGYAARPLLVGRSATDGVVSEARAGLIDILTEHPLQLIVQGIMYEAPPPGRVTPKRLPSKRKAWYRWAVERHLLLTDTPHRQSAIADLLRTSQQTVSHAARQLGQLTVDRGTGLEAADKRQLLRHWAEEYPGPGGQEFGWYSLDPIVEQTLEAVKAAELLGVAPIISGDVAADRLAPWKLPSRGRIYVTNPIDLAEDGFVPAPVEEATLVTCIPQDPTLWCLIDAVASADRVALADAVITYWDVLASSDTDSAEAASHLELLIVEGRP